MSSSVDLSHLKPEEWNQLLEMTSRLEEAWRVSGSGDITSVLSPAPADLRIVFLVELVKTELEIRYRHRQPLVLENYLQRFPELGPPENLPVELIFEEYRVRQLYGDQPRLSLYRTRFPRQFPQLEHLVSNNPLATFHQEHTASSPSSHPSATPGSGLQPIPPPRPPPPPSQSATTPDGNGPSASTNVKASNIISFGGGYELLEKIGSGQFGEVFRGRAPGGIEVAIKRIFRTLDSESGRREQAALERTKSLRHPYLLQVQAYWALEDRLYIVMELADDSLNDWFRECKKAGQAGIPTDQLLTYFLEAAEGLDFLHSRNVIHRDIKPANLLRLRGHAKVADFGLARMQEERLAEATFCGTPLYMPPEMWRSQVSIHSDQYSLALTYIELCTGKRPFSGRDQFELGRQHLMGEPDLPDFNPAERRVLRQALAKDPEKRFPTCRAFIEALIDARAASASGSGGNGTPGFRWLASLMAGGDGTTDRRWLGWLILLGLVLLAGVGGALMSVFNPFGTTTVTTPPPKLPPEVWLPPGGNKAPDANLSERLFDRIVLPVEGADPLVLVLVPHKRRDDPARFYLSLTEVTNAQFRAAMAQPRMQALLAQHRKGHPWVAPGKWQEQGGKPEEANLPVVYVTAVEAHCFAELFGGRLPSARQWDQAGGRFDGDETPAGNGPFKEIAIDLMPRRPCRVGTSSGDESRYHLFDLAGNVRELTRDISFQDQRVPVANPQPGPQGTPVVLRGNSFSSPEPFQFKLLDIGFSGYPQAVSYEEVQADVGFRIVIEPPDER